MTTRAIRVTVRGFFDGLTDQQRAHLVAEAADHDFRHTRYTPDGHLTYEMAARESFTFRFLSSAEDQAGIPDVVARAELAAEGWLTGHGYGWKRLTSTFADMSEVPLGARGRKLTR
jgi:uncharacterized protein DUF6204